MRFFFFLTLSVICFLAAGWLTLAQMRRYDAARAIFPAGTTIAGVPVGLLDSNTAKERITRLYAQTPVELRVAGGAVQVDPGDLGQTVDVDGMLRAAEMIQSRTSYWSGLWDFLFNRPPAPFTAPLACTVDENRLRAGLEEQIAPHYENPPTPAYPIPGDVRYLPGQGGQTLDLDGAVASIKTALCSATQRAVEVTLHTSGPLPPQVDQLGPALETLAQVSGFDGLIELYFQDLNTGHEVNFALNGGREIEPGVAFTAASTIKIPVMVSAYRQIDGPPSDALQNRMALMIDVSDNASTDEVMRTALDPNIAPIQVTKDMQALGLKDTFLAGFFAPGSPLLNRYETDANRRTDINTDPDIYNQTTTVDMGRLLGMIQRCAADGSGPLTSTFPGKIIQAECQSMVDLLVKNRKGVLVEAGVPEGTKMAHKYGWVTDSTDGLMHTASDAAVVYTPTGNFVLTVYLYHPAQLQWDEAQRLVARITTGIINYYQQLK